MMPPNTIFRQQLACPSYSLYVHLLWYPMNYPGGMKARVSPMQCSKTNCILAPTQDSNPRAAGFKIISGYHYTESCFNYFSMACYFIAVCTHDQFACATHGQCVPLSSRCNGIMNCLDGSDEFPCSKILYRRYLIILLLQLTSSSMTFYR